MWETYAYFYVSSFEGDPSEISRSLDLIPTRTWLKGESAPNGKERVGNHWQFHSPLSKSEIFLDAHLSSLLEILEARQNQIERLRERGAEIGINCVGYYHDEHPGF